MRAFRTQGRLLHWCPTDPDVEESKKAVPASHPNISARFVKESALQKRGTFLPDVDMMDISVRQENLNARGQPIMLQLPLVPAYALTVHKTQAAALSRAVSFCVVLRCRLRCPLRRRTTHARVALFDGSSTRRSASYTKFWDVGCLGRREARPRAKVRIV